MEKQTKTDILKALAISGLCGTIGYAILGTLQMNRELISRDYVVPRGPGSLSINTEDLDRDGKVETIASYHGRDYLFKVGTNGVPYFEPIKRLEIKVEE